MKKNVLALSITAALVGFGFAGSAQAQATATTLAFNASGTGHMLLVPYFTTQGGNSTLISLINTDTVNGKAVKVRFRGASNSDDVLDFQVFLSPGDVFPMSLGVGANGATQLTTSTTENPDVTCTKPNTGVNGASFGLGRLGGQGVEQTREGYLEIFNMGDIVNTAVAGDLYDAVLHQTASGRCAGADWEALDKYSTAQTIAGLVEPTTGLMANWSIVNVSGAGAAWGGAATAIVANALGQPAKGRKVYWPQSKTPFTAIPLVNVTADPILANGIIPTLEQDLPDLSTPYTIASPLATVQAFALSSAIATSAVNNEFLTNSAIGARTDFVFSMPTRRYSVAYDYAANVASYTDLGAKDFFASTNITVDTAKKQLCVTGIGYVGWDREENLTTDPTEIVISPAVGDPTQMFCGETSVLSVNYDNTTTGALQASLATKSIDVSTIAPVAGWLNMTTPGANTRGLPILGSSFVSMSTGTAFIGASWPHRVTLTGGN